MLGAHKSKDQTLPLLVRHILTSTGAQDSLVVKGGLYVTLVSDGPMSSGPRSQFTAHFPSNDRRASPGSTWRVTCKNRHYALGAGWNEHEKVSLSLVQASGQSPGTYGGRAGAWGQSQDSKMASLRGSVASALPFPITPGSPLEGPTVQTS